MIDHVGISLPSLAEGRASTAAPSSCSAIRASRRRAAASSSGTTSRSARRPRTGRSRGASTSGSTRPHRRPSTPGGSELTDAGYASDGAPGPRPAYGPEYYGAFVLDPAGNSVEAVQQRPAPAARGDRPPLAPHPLARGRDAGSTRRSALPSTTPSSATTAARRSAARAPPSRSSRGRRPRTSTSPSRHRIERRSPRSTQAGIGAGYASNGEPGERPEYHPGYYAAFLTDPDGHNIEAVFHDRS